MPGHWQKVIEAATPVRIYMMAGAKSLVTSEHAHAIGIN